MVSLTTSRAKIGTVLSREPGDEGEARGPPPALGPHPAGRDQLAEGTKDIGPASADPAGQRTSRGRSFPKDGQQGLGQRFRGVRQRFWGASRLGEGPMVHRARSSGWGANTVLLTLSATATSRCPAGTCRRPFGADTFGPGFGVGRLRVVHQPLLPRNHHGPRRDRHGLASKKACAKPGGVMDRRALRSGTLAPQPPPTPELGRLDGRLSRSA